MDMTPCRGTGSYFVGRAGSRGAIAIARMLLRKAPIMVFDDSFSISEEWIPETDYCIAAR